MTDPTVERPSLGPVLQIGFVVRDAEAVAARWALLFGLPAPRVVNWPLRPGMRAELRGEPIELKMKIAFVETDSMQLEFIQPLEPNNIYEEFLQTRGEGLHHVLFEMENPEETAKKLQVEIVQSGSTIREGGQWFVLDTQQLLGMLLEGRRLPPKEK